MARPRTFEPKDALDAIKMLFWEGGYHGTSMSDIEAATGLKKPSLYRVFGDKRQMYLSALRDYGKKEFVTFVPGNVDPGSAKTLFANFFTGIIERDDRRGCFVCNASIDQAQTDEATRRCVQKLMLSLRDQFSHALTASLHYERNQQIREMVAAQLLTTYCGLQVLIRSDPPRDVLHKAIVETTDKLKDDR